MLEVIGKVLRDSLQDSATGKYSQARIITMLVAVAATVFMWKLVLLGGMQIDYFIAYLAYGTGHQTLNKFLDTRNNGKPNVIIHKDDDEPLPKPPKIK